MASVSRELTNNTKDCGEQIYRAPVQLKLASWNNLVSQILGVQSAFCCRIFGLQSLSCCCNSERKENKWSMTSPSSNHIREHIGESPNFESYSRSHICFLLIQQQTFSGFSSSFGSDLNVFGLKTQFKKHHNNPSVFLTTNTSGLSVVISPLRLESETPSRSAF